MLFLSPFIFMPNTIDSGWFRFYISFCINQFFVMALFYLNYVYLINRFLFRKQTLNFIVTNLFVIISLLIVYYLIDRLFLRDGGHFGPDLRFGWLLMIMGDIIKYSLTAALSVAIKMTVRWYQTESERNEFEKVRVEAELKNLKSQLNPHFLFNTLNNIYSLIDINQ